MAGRIEARLAELKIDLPSPAKPVANYVPYVVSGPLVVIAGQVPLEKGEVKYRGRVGEELGAEEGQAAARLCALNMLGQLKEACAGDLDRVTRCVRLGVFVASANGFTDQPKVANGASDLMVEVFGELGRHARTAVGTNVLPLNCAVEVEGFFALT